MKTELLKRSQRYTAEDDGSRFAVVDLGVDKDGYQVKLRIYPHLPPRYFIDRSKDTDDPRTVLATLFQ